MFQVGLLTVSDRASRGEYEDKAGPLMVTILTERTNWQVVRQGVVADVVQPNHPILSGFSGEWLALLGFNELVPKADAEVLAKAGEHPLLAVQTVGKGRTLAWASDIGPHWCPQPFLQWEGYGRLWRQAITWLAGRG